tara:strand:- start:359 stop:589 length:231 start_codon:yes stop_codon:yes gene_type:complete
MLPETGLLLVPLQQQHMLLQIILQALLLSDVPSSLGLLNTNSTATISDIRATANDNQVIIMAGNQLHGLQTVQSHQ